MNIIGEFKCPKCGWVHIGISEADAIAAVDSVNAYLKTLSEDGRQRFGRTKASLASYKCCFRCGSPSKDFVPAKKADRPAGVTLQAVVAPES